MKLSSRLRCLLPCSLYTLIVSVRAKTPIFSNCHGIKSFGVQRSTSPNSFHGILRTCHEYKNLFTLRGGSTDENSDDDEVEGLGAEEEDEQRVEVTDEDEYDEEEYDDDDYDIDSPEDRENAEMQKIVEPYFLSPAVQLYATFGCMILSRRVDLFSPTVVRIIRFAFIIQTIIQQLFILFVRVAAKKRNDTAKVMTHNPLSGILQSQLQQQGNANAMVKQLASSFLSSEITVTDYDRKEAANMQGSVIMNMAFMWFLHFKMEKVQPLVMQIVTGFLQLIYSPLFQVYVMGRHLERPFKTAAGATRGQLNTSSTATTDDEAEENADSEASGGAGDTPNNGNVSRESAATQLKDEVLNQPEQE